MVKTYKGEFIKNQEMGFPLLKISKNRFGPANIIGKLYTEYHLKSIDLEKDIKNKLARLLKNILKIQINELINEILTKKLDII